MSFLVNNHAMSQSPAVTLRNLGLSPKSLMASISQMNRMTPDFIPLLSLPPSDNSFPQPLREFTKFPELPVELRLKIWEHVCFLERNIDLMVKSLGELHQKNGCFKSYEFVADHSHPDVLFACKESRAVALMHYRLSFGTFHQTGHIRVSTLSTIYVNWECDRICLFWPDQLGEYRDPSFTTFVKICRDNKLRYIALNVMQDTHWYYVDLTIQIPSLREVLLFGSAAPEVEFGAPKDLNLITMETFAARCPRSWQVNSNQVWASRLEGHRRDLTTFFELNTYKEVPKGAATSVSVESWQPPKIELGYATIDGHPELSGWDW